MSKPIIMPRQGQSVESCIITKWHKSEGDSVNLGDILFTYETDKATFEEESDESGTLLAIFFPEGSDVPCLTNVCAIGDPGEDVSAHNPSCDPDTSSTAPHGYTQQAPIASPSEISISSAQVSTDMVSPMAIPQQASSPRARNLAQRAGVDLISATPTGPGGRIIERDIDRLLANAANSTADTASKAPSIAAPISPATAQYETLPLSNIRKLIAKSMHQSLSTMAQLTLNGSFDISDIMVLREKLKAANPALKITINDIILFAVSRVLKKHRELNAHYLDDSMKLFNDVNLGIAMDTARGLIVPTLFGADRMPLSQISSQTKALSDMAQSGSISPDLITGGTFTVTNLGTFGIESFTPVINPPQTGILGVNTIIYRNKPDGSVYPCMPLSITFDHRAIDGAPTARFLKELCEYLENFSVNLLLDTLGI